MLLETGGVKRILWGHHPVEAKTFAFERKMSLLFFLKTFRGYAHGRGVRVASKVRAEIKSQTFRASLKYILRHPFPSCGLMNVKRF